MLCCTTLMVKEGTVREHMANDFEENTRGVETVGPVSPVGHRHLRSDSNTVLPVQMSETSPEYLKCYLGDISACTHQIALKFHNQFIFAFI